jgi:hypothetical protein
VALAAHAQEKDRSFGPDRSPDGKYFPSKNRELQPILHRLEETAAAPARVHHRGARTPGRLERIWAGHGGQSISSRLRPPGRNPAIYSPGLDVKHAWVGANFQSHPGVRGCSFKIASSRPLHKRIAQSSAIGSARIRRSNQKLD